MTADRSVYSALLPHLQLQGAGDRRGDSTPAAEPGQRAVVLDRDGLVWQHLGPHWYSPFRPLVMLGPTGYTWLDLHADRGPLSLITTGDVPLVGPGAAEQRALGEIADYFAEMRDNDEAPTREQVEP